MPSAQKLAEVTVVKFAVTKRQIEFLCASEMSIHKHCRPITDINRNTVTPVIRLFLQ
jgi:hypothetical protein